jgi:hypothetical protein
MPICKFKKHHKDFVIIDKTGLVDDKLSWKAKGILSYFMTLPDNWKIKLAEVVKHATDGKAALTSGLNELINHGYCEIIKKRNQDGSIKEFEYVIYESPEIKLKNIEPQTGLQQMAEMENIEPQTGFPLIDKLLIVNRSLIRNNISKELDNTIVLSPAEDFEQKSEDIDKKKKKKKPRLFHPDSLGGTLAQYMLDEIEKHNPTYPTPELGEWEAYFNKMMFVEGKTSTQIKNIIWFSQYSEFWKPFIINPYALNAKYETLKIQLTQLRKRQSSEREKEDIFDRAKEDFFKKTT